MIRRIPHADPNNPNSLTSLKTNHRENMNEPFITNAITIELNHLKQFIRQAEAVPTCDAIRIHFVRHPLTASQGHIEKIDNRDLSQVSLVFVPANITVAAPDWVSVNLPEGNNILALLVCEPTGTARTNDDKTGQCPPKPPGCQN